MSMLPRKQKFTNNNLRAMFRIQRRGLEPQRTDRADTWRVPSESAPGVSYTVTVTDVAAKLETDCSCKAGQAKRGCKHQLLVLHEFIRNNRHWIDLLTLQAERKDVAA